MHRLENKIVEVENVSFAYDDEAVLQNVSLSICEGDYFGIIGSNGAGKTTLLKIILGLLRPTKGTVKIFGTNIESFKSWERIGYLPQNVARFEKGFPATVQEVVMMGRFGRLGLLKTPQKADFEAVKNSLMEVEMWDFKDRLIGELSGGQQQRVFIARALASNPEVIFFDEPTVGIDQASRTEFYSLLRDLNKHHGITLVLVSHDLTIVLEEAQHIACINKSVIFHGEPQDFVKDASAKQMFQEHLHLDHPRHE